MLELPNKGEDKKGDVFLEKCSLKSDFPLLLFVLNIFRVSENFISIKEWMSNNWGQIVSIFMKEIWILL